jgi:hypothetical protein
MSKLHPSKDSRTTYDQKRTGVVRSFFGAELVEPISKTKRALAPASKSDHFLKVNRDLFNLDNISLKKGELREGSDSLSVSYGQEHHGVPVYGAQLVVGQRKADGTVTSSINALDYEIPATLTPQSASLKDAQAETAVRTRFESRFATLEIGTPTLYVYRHVADESIDLDLPLSAIRREMLRLGTGTPGQIYLVWQILMRTREPDGSWELLVDATNAGLVAIKDRRRYATPKADIFWPDPIRSKKDDSLSWSTSESDLNAQLAKDVPLENLDSAVNGKYKLDGTRVRTRDREKPDNTLPETSTDFKYGAKSKEFLNVMAYYYLDRLITDLRGYGITTFNNVTTDPIEVDAQGYQGLNNSHFDPDGTPGNSTPFIGFGTDTDESDGPHVPDAQDPGVVVHEYGHAIHEFLNRNQSYAHEHWFCDFLAVAWVDRYNKHQYVRAEMFPWDNNSGNEWSSIRRVDLTQRFDDSGFSGYQSTLQGAIGATALWDWFLNIGGNSISEGVRKWAADEAIHTYIEMLISTAANTTHENLAKGLITADINRTGGLYKKVIWDAFRRRGLWNDFTQTGNVDLYVRDSDTDTGEHASPQIHWTSPDIWVRNNPLPANPNDPNDPNYGENPDDGHQPPINNVPNYLYVRVHNRGSQPAAANTFTVEAFHCSPATAMLWPTHFQSMGTLPITTDVPANGGSVRIGPFLWTPQIVDHECLLAVVKGSTDQTIADDVKTKGTVDHWKLVRFDNNVGQRNVKPAPSTPGGKTKTSFLIRGTTHPSTNTLRLDASSLPADTKISVRLGRSITDNAASISGLVLSTQNDRWSNFALAGGIMGKIVGFPLGTSEEKSVSLEIDFSYQAEHLKRYPIIAGQEQNGVLAGQLTIEIVAVKESEDYLYGNVRSREVHTLNCTFRKAMNPRNQVPFQTIKDALAHGYNGCRYCLPKYSSD